MHADLEWKQHTRFDRQYSNNIINQNQLHCLPPLNRNTRQDLRPSQIPQPLGLSHFQSFSDHCEVFETTVMDLDFKISILRF